jgi:hypothetical protein
MKQAARIAYPYSVTLKPSSNITAYTTATDVVERATPQSQVGMMGPMQRIMCDRGATEKGTEEPREANDRSFSPLDFENGRIEFRTGKERQDDCASSSQESDPLRIPGQAALRKPKKPSKKDADDQLGHSPNHNSGKRRRDLEPDSQQRRPQCKSHPERTKSPSVRHQSELLDFQIRDCAGT